MPELSDKAPGRSQLRWVSSRCLKTGLLFLAASRSTNNIREEMVLCPATSPYTCGCFNRDLQDTVHETIQPFVPVPKAFQGRRSYHALQTQVGLAVVNRLPSVAHHVPARCWIAGSATDFSSLNRSFINKPVRRPSSWFVFHRTPSGTFSVKRGGRRPGIPC